MTGLIVTPGPRSLDLTRIPDPKIMFIILIIIFLILIITFFILRFG